MRRQVATVAALIGLAAPTSALATPYLTLTEAWLAAKTAVAQRFHKQGAWGVGKVNSPRTDCHWNGSTSVDCGYEVVFLTMQPGQLKLCSGKVRLRMTRHYRIVSVVQPQPTCQLARQRG